MNEVICPACKKQFPGQVGVCSRCNYPFNGTEKERGVHIGTFITQKGVIMDADIFLEKSQLLLYAVAGLNILMLFMYGSEQILVPLHITINIIISVIVFLCGYHLRKKPIWFSLIPLILLPAVYTLNYLMDPDTLVRGLEMKIALIGSLLYSMYLIKSAEKFKKDYDIE